MDRSIIRLKINNEKEEDIDIPLNITAVELLIGLNEAYNLGYNMAKISEYCLHFENPICMARGEKTLNEYGIMNGSILNVLKG